jgi:ABC-type nitrate/sulfonate/bicarbonate transport system permease component
VRVASIGLLITLLACASRVSAQSRPAPFPAFEIAAQWQSLDPASPRLPDPAFQPKQSHSHTLTGFLIGAAIGGALGYLFYNGLCEAVDNNCYDSRVRYVLIGGVSGGALGALIGSFSD